MQAAGSLGTPGTQWACFLLGHFSGLGSSSGLCVKVHCKHLLGLCMVNIYKLLELEHGN